MRDISQSNLFAEKEYLTTYFLSRILGVTVFKNREQLEGVLEELYKNKVMYLEEDGKEYPLVERHHSSGRYPDFYVVKNNEFVIALISRIVKERGIYGVPQNEGYSALRLAQDLKTGHGSKKIKKYLEDEYHLATVFYDESGKLCDLVIKTGDRYMLHPSSNAFRIFKEKMEKREHPPVITHARLAVKLGLHKGFGTLLEKQLKRAYDLNYVFVDSFGKEQPLIHKYQIAGKERFYLSSDPNAFQLFKKMRAALKEKEEYIPELIPLFKAHYGLFKRELQAVYQEGKKVLDENNNQIPLVTKKCSLYGQDRFILAESQKAQLVFLNRLEHRIAQNKLDQNTMGLTFLINRIKGTDSFSVTQMLKMLYDEMIFYSSDDKNVYPLVVKKCGKYCLRNDEKALEIFTMHLKAFVSSYSKKIKGYTSYSQQKKYFGDNLTCLRFYSVLEELLKEGIVIQNNDGQSMPLVQRFRSGNKIAPYFFHSPAGISLIKERIMRQKD